MEQLKFPAIVCLLFLLFSCGEQPADLKKAEQLTTQGLYNQAERILKTALRENYSDTLQYARIQARIKIIRRFRFFQPLDTLIAAQRWPQADTVWRRLNSALNDSSKRIGHFYGFDLFHKKSILDSALNREDAYWNDLKKGLPFPTANQQLVRLKYEKLGFYLAERDSLEEARAMFDRSLRIIRISKLAVPQKKAYFFYMEGHFKECLHALQSLPDSAKDKHWENLQTFLKRYGNKLTLYKRFKLW